VATEVMGVIGSLYTQHNLIRGISCNVLKMEAESSSETLVSVCQCEQCHIPEENNPRYTLLYHMPHRS
jgi:hypothetical protein